MSPEGSEGREEDLSHVRSGGHSVPHIPSGGWRRRGLSQPYMQWGTHSGTCHERGVREERRISAMYAVGDAQCHISPVGDGGGEDYLSHVCNGGCLVAHVPSGGWWRISAIYAVGDGQ